MLHTLWILYLYLSRPALPFGAALTLLTPSSAPLSPCRHWVPLGISSDNCKRHHRSAHAQVWHPLLVAGSIVTDPLKFAALNEDLTVVHDHSAPEDVLKHTVDYLNTRGAASDEKRCVKGANESQAD